MQNRRGGAALEAALIAPVMVFILISAIDIGQYINTAHIISNAAREGARAASRVDSRRVNDVSAAVMSYLGNSLPQMTDNQLEEATLIEVRDADGHPIPNDFLAGLDSGDSVSVRVRFDFNEIRWIHGFDYWNGQFKESTSVSRRY
ncbi:MAG: TadE family protein [Pirellulaceae bacterium]